MKSKFAKNLGIMGIIGILIKLIGAVYRIPLAHFISENAVAYYGLAYPWYNFLVVLSSIALPAALAKLTAEALVLEDEQGKWEIFTVSRWLTNGFGIVSALFLIFFAGSITKVLGNPEAVYAFYVLGVSSYFVSLNASYRGFFQGNQRLELFGMSQLLEQIGRVGLGLLIVIVFSKMALGDAAMAGAATSGAGFGALLSFLYVSSRFRKHFDFKKVVVKDWKAIAKRILKLAWPIAIGASIMPLISMMDTVIVVRRLIYLGYEKEMAAIMYSYISYYALPIINLSQVVFSAIQLSLLPMITNSFTIKSPRLKKQVGLGLLLSLALGLPMGLGIAIFSKEILLFLYPSKADIVVEAASVLRYLSFAIIFLSVYLATTAMLQGMNAYKQPMHHLVVGAVAKLISAYVLIGIPAINIDGAAISTLLAYAIAAALNVRLLFKLQKPDVTALKKILLTIFANGLMVLSAKGTYAFLNGSLGLSMSKALLLAIAVAVVVYGGCVLGLKIVTKADFETI